MFRVLPLFVLLAVGISAWDHFEFDITLFCNFEERGDYNLRAEWWEVDSILSSEDQISQPKIMKVKTGRQSFSMDGAMNGDEMLSAGYKPKVYFSHDCTNDKKRVDLTLTITTLCDIGSTCHYRIIRDITNDSGQYEVEAIAFKKEMTPFPDFP